MKNLQRVFVAVLLALMLTLPAFAGQIETPLAPPSSLTTQGDISTPNAGNISTISSGATAANSVTEIALNLLGSVLALV